MTLGKLNINAAIKEVELLLGREKSLSPALKSAIKVLILVVRLLANRFGLDSKNSSTPPSEDKNRKRGSTRKKSNKKPGGQNGHIGARLKKVDKPDVIKELRLDKRRLPKGSNYKKVGYKSRQVFDIEISSRTIEYRAEILENESGKRFVAPFPSWVKKDVQYGLLVKADAVYMSQYQLIPYARVQEQFADQMKLPLSQGSLFNFNKEAYNALEKFEMITKQHLSEAALLHADETGIQVDKKQIWLHTATNKKWTHFYPHIKRGNEATNEIGILPAFHGIMCHDHWKPYYKYGCTHALCNAHHIRELRYAHEHDKQKWAKSMKRLLEKINDAVDAAGGSLSKEAAEKYRLKYRKLISSGDKECPAAKRKPHKKGRTKQSKSRNLLVRLRDFEDDVLRFMENEIVPFTNNLGENALRMTKVQQKISGCFRSMEGAYIFCRVRGYISTCQKHGVKATEALRLLFQGKLPDFVNDSQKKLMVRLKNAE